MNRDQAPAILSPPSPTSRSTLPEWRCAGEWTVKCDGHHRAWHDICVGGVGWVAVAGDASRVALRAWTPGGVGVVVRDPLVPFEVAEKAVKVE